MKDRDDMVYGSLIALPFEIIGGLVCFFSCKNEILWLSILGLVLTVVAALISLASGAVPVLSAAIFVSIAAVFRNKLIEWKLIRNARFISDMLVRDFDYYFVVFLALLACASLLFGSIITLASGLNSEK